MLREYSIIFTVWLQVVSVALSGLEKLFDLNQGYCPGYISSDVRVSNLMYRDFNVYRFPLKLVLGQLLSGNVRESRGWTTALQSIDIFEH